MSAKGFTVGASYVSSAPIARASYLGYCNPTSFGYQGCRGLIIVLRESIVNPATFLANIYQEMAFCMHNPGSKGKRRREKN